MSRLIECWTRELGCDAAQVAFELYPDVVSLSPEKQEEILDRIEGVMKENRWPPTVEYGQRAYRWLQSSDAVDRAAGEQPAPAAFTPKSEEVEQDFFNDPNTTTEQIGRYLQQKHNHR
jgi:hypothetical protein